MAFGGLLLAGLAAIFYMMFPQLFVTAPFGFKAFVGFFGLLGTTTQRGIHSALKFAWPKVAELSSFYEKLAHAKVHLLLGALTPEKYEQIKNALYDRFFDIPPDKQLKP